MSARCRSLPLAIALLVLAAAPAAAQLSVELFATTPGPPVRLVAPPDDSRVFVVEQDGAIRAYEQDGTALGVFLDLGDLTDPGGEQGLLGLAFAPDYDRTGRFYVDYTDLNGDTRVARYEVSAGDRNRADPASGEIILTVTQPFSNHNGGHLEFGPDGMLYVGLGDGGDSGDPGNRAQADTTLLGKLLRLDVAVAAGYAIPPDNPFVQSPALDEIWVKGLRNPWTFAFDGATGDLYICDVGQNSIEEIDVQPASSAGGENYGWRLMEGSECYDPPVDCNDGTLVLPVHEYTHGGSPFRCSISGGQVYRGGAIGDVAGQFFFSDFCSNQIWSITWEPGQGVTAVQEWTELTTPAGGYGGIASIGRDAAGELYVVDRGDRRIYRLVPDTTGAGDLPPATARLEQNIPNPFNPRTEIAYEVPRGGAHVRLQVHDLRGHRIRTLVDARRSEGRHVTGWDGLDDRGQAVAAGAYAYTLDVGGVTLRRTMTLVR